MEGILMKNIFKFLALATLLNLMATDVVLAHGEDKPGPHGGSIRMPGAFHVEVVNAGPAKFQIYLLDINWKNASTRNSSVEASIINGDKKEALKCVQETSFYLCSLQSKNRRAKATGQLEILSQREGQKGNVVQYDLPLK